MERRNVASQSVIVGVLVLLALIFGGVLVSCHYKSKEVSLRNSIIAQRDVMKVTYDSAWKIVSQQVQVTDKASAEFRKIYVDIMEARYQGSEGDSFFKVIQESNPQFDMSMYTRLLNSIEATRGDFTHQQKVLADKCREYKTFVQTPFINWFVEDGNPDCSVVTSTKTENTFQTGKEDDVNLYPTPGEK